MVWLAAPDQRPLAQAGFRLLIPDQCGYNLSDKPKGVKAYRLEELSRDIIGLLDNLGRQTCRLVGHDWGAAVAWNVGLAYHHRIEKLVIMNVPHPAVMLSFLRKILGRCSRAGILVSFRFQGFPIGCCEQMTVLPVDQRLHMPVLMLWGKQDVALSHAMAQPSIERCDQGKLVFFEEATHWVQHD